MKWESELYHHGILGQKWGIRRYQNEDGALTELGKKHIKENRNYASKTEKALRSGKDATDDAKNLIKDISNSKKKNVEDLSSYSDEELRKTVSRMNLERQYRQMTEPEMSKGEEYATKTLSIVGDVLAIGASAAGIYLALKAKK